VRVLGEEPGPGLPNQHTKACPRFQTMHCSCPPATGPNQPHEKDCYQYRRPSASYSTSDASGLSGKLSGKFHTGPFFGHGLPYRAKLSVMQAQAYNAALQWLDKQNPAPLGAPIECNGGCTCAAASGVIGHASFCPLGEKVESDAAAYADPQELPG
jgi:hypothetical protein